MNLQPLLELQERLENCAIAGSRLLTEDFRLKRAVEAFAPLATASPVFQKIQAQLNRLLDPATQDIPAVLMDTLALVDAVVYTQGISNVPGELEPIPEQKGSVYHKTPYSALAPLIQALTSTGSGRYEIVRNAIEKQDPCLHDYRILPLLIRALGDTYGELADLVANYLAGCGKAILPLLKEGFDPKGKTEMLRRLHVIITLGGAEENNWYLSILGDCEKEMRTTVISALSYDVSNTDLLFDLLKSERGAAKKAVQESLFRMNTPKALEYTQKQNPVLVAQSFRSPAVDPSPEQADFLAEAMEKFLSNLESSPNPQLSKEDAQSFSTLLQVSWGRFSEKLLDFYRHFADFLNQHSIFNESGKEISLFSSLLSVSIPIRNAFPLGLAYACILCRRQELSSLVRDFYLSYGGSFFFPYCLDQMLSLQASDFYHQFSPIFLENAKSREQREKQTALLLLFIRFPLKNGKYTYLYHYTDNDCQFEKRISLPGGIDGRWFELFLKMVPLSLFETDSGCGVSVSVLSSLCFLANPCDPLCVAAMEKLFQSPDRRDRPGQYSYSVIFVLLENGWTSFKGLLPLLYRSGNEYYSYASLRAWYQKIQHFMKPTDIAEELEWFMQQITKNLSGTALRRWDQDQMKHDIALLRQGNFPF